MSWNYRVVKKVTKIPHRLNKQFGETDISYEIHDVYYDKYLDKPSIGRLSFPMGDDVESLQWSLERMLEACKKPILDYNTGEEIT